MIGQHDQHWCRVVMDRESERLVRSLPYAGMSALEISGDKWQNFGFASYRSVGYPEYDVCEGPLEKEAFDLIILEQVLEHVYWPYRAVRNIYQMLKPGGAFLVTTPFLLKIHNYPVDCSRWTPLGMKYLLAEGGFPLDLTEVGSWGNRRCVWSNFRDWTRWTPMFHSLRNEPDFPIVVWALGRKPR